ncbi:hypothetical protein [Kitasatospora sp. NPDC091207]|uniref:hypothetical protein n=1 Tax=Kitasatospora sp. NPDC091207 TaxID=3364083 RepID=UPI00381B5A96
MFSAVVLLVGVAVLAGTFWLVWCLAGVRLVAAAGIGPVDGVVAVSRCYGTTDLEGNATGIDCQGWYTPAGAARAERTITLSDAKKSYPTGHEVGVRLAAGRAFEDSPSTVFEYGIFAVILLAMGGALAGWLFSSAWRGEAGADGFMVFCLAPLAAVVGAVPVLLVVVGLRALFR